MALIVLRDATPTDFAAVLELNAESVHFLSPLDEARLVHLHSEAVYHRVLEERGRVVAFLLGLREFADYDSVNYRWFASRYPRFLYIDRVVVGSQGRGRGLGRLLYDDLFAVARHQQVPYVTCEIDIEPPNDISRRFHSAYGFREVGSQWVGDGSKRVSLLIAQLTSAD